MNKMFDQILKVPEVLQTRALVYYLICLGLMHTYQESNYVCTGPPIYHSDCRRYGYGFRYDLCITLYAFALGA